MTDAERIEQARADEIFDALDVDARMAAAGGVHQEQLEPSVARWLEARCRAWYCARTNDPRSAAIAILDDAAATSSVVRIGDREWQFCSVGGHGYFMAQLCGRPRETVRSIACHVAADGTLRCSGDGEFGEHFPGPRVGTVPS